MDGNGHDTSPDFAGSDELLSLSVKDAISRSEPIRASSMELIDVHSTGGKVLLTGLVGSEAQKYVAGQLAASVPGVAGVENRLVTREDIERHVALALAASPETRHLRIHVRVSDSTVSLYGAVATPQEAAAVASIAEGAAGDLQVRSEVRTLPADQETIILEQHSLEGRKMTSRPQETEQPRDDVEPVPPVQPASAPPAPPVEGMA